MAYVPRVDIKRALLVIADIGGYTRFMLATRMSLAHAHLQIASLLEAVLDGPEKLQLAKLEGDAVFFHAPGGADLEAEIGRMRARFEERKSKLVADRNCTCAACTHLEDLTLKFVAHEGEVAYHRVKENTELAGVDVILLHRMLKNDVPVKEYVLLTDAALTDSLRGKASPLDHDFEGIGKTTTHWVRLEAIPTPPPVPVKGFGALVEKAKLTARALPYFFKIKKPLEGTRLMSEPE